MTPERLAEYRQEAEKCIVLCSRCHSKLHSKKAAEVYQAIQDRFSWLLALCLTKATPATAADERRTA
jgi:hypothetical protein